MVTKMMGLGYPGGPIIEDLAKTMDPDVIKFPRSLLDKKGFEINVINTMHETLEVSAFYAIIYGYTTNIKFRITCFI